MKARNEDKNDKNVKINQIQSKKRTSEPQEDPKNEQKSQKLKKKMNLGGLRLINKTSLLLTALVSVATLISPTLPKIVYNFNRPLYEGKNNRFGDVWYLEAWNEVSSVLVRHGLNKILLAKLDNSNEYSIDLGFSNPTRTDGPPSKNFKGGLIGMPLLMKSSNRILICHRKDQIAMVELNPSTMALTRLYLVNPVNIAMGSMDVISTTSNQWVIGASESMKFGMIDTTVTNGADPSTVHYDYSGSKDINYFPMFRVVVFQEYKKIIGINNLGGMIRCSYLAPGGANTITEDFAINFTPDVVGSPGVIDASRRQKPLSVRKVPGSSLYLLSIIRSVQGAPHYLKMFDATLPVSTHEKGSKIISNNDYLDLTIALNSTTALGSDTKGRMFFIDLTTPTMPDLKDTAVGDFSATQRPFEGVDTILGTYDHSTKRLYVSSFHFSSYYFSVLALDFACFSKCGTCLGSEEDSCTSCPSGYELSAQNYGKCKILCPAAGKFRDDNVDLYTCQSCITGCDECSDTSTCTTCGSGYTKNTGTGKCEINCPAGQYRSAITTCTNCPTGCATCTSNTACQSCSTDYTELSTPDGLCYPSCPKGQFRTTPTTCLGCIANCDTCSDTSTCLTCSSGFSTNSAKKCQRDCGDGYFNSDLVTCSACITGCKTCSTTTECQVCDGPEYSLLGAAPNKCRKNCGEGHFNSDLVTCSQCMAGCAECQNAAQCQRCSAGFTLIPASNGICYQDCQKGQFRPQGLTTCSDCPTGCSECLDGSRCTACLQDYTLMSDSSCYPCWSRTERAGCEFTRLGFDMDDKATTGFNLDANAKIMIRLTGPDRVVALLGSENVDWKIFFNFESVYKTSKNCSEIGYAYIAEVNRLEVSFKSCPEQLKVRLSPKNHSILTNSSGTFVTLNSSSEAEAIDYIIPRDQIPPREKVGNTVKVTTRTVGVGFTIGLIASLILNPYLVGFIGNLLQMVDLIASFNLINVVYPTNLQLFFDFVLGIFSAPKIAIFRHVYDRQAPGVRLSTVSTGQLSQEYSGKLTFDNYGLTSLVYFLILFLEWLLRKCTKSASLVYKVTLTAREFIFSYAFLEIYMNLLIDARRAPVVIMQGTPPIKALFLMSQIILAFQIFIHAQSYYFIRKYHRKEIIKNLSFKANATVARAAARFKINMRRRRMTGGMRKHSQMRKNALMSLLRMGSGIQDANQIRECLQEEEEEKKGQIPGQISRKSSQGGINFSKMSARSSNASKLSLSSNIKSRGIKRNPTKYSTFRKFVMQRNEAEAQNLGRLSMKTASVSFNPEFVLPSEPAQKMDLKRKGSSTSLDDIIKDGNHNNLVDNSFDTTRLGGESQEANQRKRRKLGAKSSLGIRFNSPGKSKGSPTKSPRKKCSEIQLFSRAPSPFLDQKSQNDPSPTSRKSSIDSPATPQKLILHKMNIKRIQNSLDPTKRRQQMIDKMSDLEVFNFEVKENSYIINKDNFQDLDFPWIYHYYLPLEVSRYIVLQTVICVTQNLRETHIALISISQLVFFLFMFIGAIRYKFMKDGWLLFLYVIQEFSITIFIFLFVVLENVAKGSSKKGLFGIVCLSGCMILEFTIIIKKICFMKKKKRKKSAIKRSRFGGRRNRKMKNLVQSSSSKMMKDKDLNKDGELASPLKRAFRRGGRSPKKSKTTKSNLMRRRQFFDNENAIAESHFEDELSPPINLKKKEMEPMKRFKRSRTKKMTKNRKVSGTGSFVAPQLVLDAAGDESRLCGSPLKLKRSLFRKKSKIALRERIFMRMEQERVQDQAGQEGAYRKKSAFEELHFDDLEDNDQEVDKRQKESPESPRKALNQEREVEIDASPVENYYQFPGNQNEKKKPKVGMNARQARKHGSALSLRKQVLKRDSKNQRSSDSVHLNLQNSAYSPDQDSSGVASLRGSRSPAKKRSKLSNGDTPHFYFEEVNFGDGEQEGHNSDPVDEKGSYGRSSMRKKTRSILNSRFMSRNSNMTPDPFRSPGAINQGKFGLVDGVEGGRTAKGHKDAKRKTSFDKSKFFGEEEIPRSGSMGLGDWKALDEDDDDWLGLDD